MKIFLAPVAAFLITAAATSGHAQTFQTVHTFPADGSEGIRPWATLTIGPDRDLYGTASEGGTGDGLGASNGTVFKYSISGTFTLLGNFTAANTGRVPKARLVNIGDGFLYGATSQGTGTAGDPSGTVFKVNPAGTPSESSTITKVFALPGSGTTPKVPLSLVSGEAGVLHVLGSSPGGIWRVPLDGGTPTVAFQFASSGDEGIAPQSIIRGADQNLYGVTLGTSYVDTTPGRQGTIFRVAPGGTGFTTLHDCDYPTGVAPLGGLVEANGIFYGTGTSGGVNGNGVIFRITAAGDYTVIHDVDDHVPTSELLLASDGKLYGTSSNGGSALYGAVFRINTDGTGFKIIQNFTKTNGAYPKGGLVQADDGHLYGTTSEGGANNKGTIFRIDLNLPPPAVNRPPVAINDHGSSSGSAVNVAVLANDFDPDDDALTVTIDHAPEFGTATVQPDGTITYQPGGAYNGSDEFGYRITDPDGLSSTAEVTISNGGIPPAWQAGVYNGILSRDPNLAGDRDLPRGQLIINVSETGVFTGKLFTQKKRLTVRGVFDQDGVGIGIVNIPKQGKAVFFLAGSPEGEGLTAVLFGKETWSGYLSPLHYLTPNTTQAYTLGIYTDDLHPRGNGFGFLKVSPIGVVVGAGKFSDGTPLVFGSTLSRSGVDGQIPIFCEPIKGGAFASVVNEQQGTSYKYGATARWIRPAVVKSPFPTGFALDSSVYVFPFTPAARGAVALDFGNDQAGLVAVAGIDNVNGSTGIVNVSGARLVCSAPLLSLSINRTTGIFTGRIKTQTAAGLKTVPFQGAVYQSLQRGEGFYIYKQAPGFVILEGEPTP